MMLLKDLADQWLSRQRKRVELGKLKPATLPVTSHVNIHIVPCLGDLEIETIRNGKVREFAEVLATSLGPKTVREIVATLKHVLESHVNQDGEPILDLKWRSKFIFENVREIGRRDSRRLAGTP